MGKRNAVDRLMVRIKQENKSLKKRVKHLEYDIIDIRLKLKPVSEVRQIGFAQHSNLHTDNEFDQQQRLKEKKR